MRTGSAWMAAGERRTAITVESAPEIRPEFTHFTEIVGTLACLAPEQTGRTGRSGDPRADLYALSVSDDGVGGANLTGGGTLTVQSPPGQGTRLAVAVPVNADRPSSSG